MNSDPSSTYQMVFWINFVMWSATWSFEYTWEISVWCRPHHDAHTNLWWCFGPFFVVASENFTFWLPVLNEWSWGLGRTSLLARVCIENWVEECATFWMGDLFWFWPHRINRSHLWIYFLFIRPFKQPIETFRLVISHYTTPLWHCVY